MAANQEELLAYLSHALPLIPHGPNVHPGPNTSNARYGPQDITHVGNWATFTYQNIINGWGNHLRGPGCALMNQEPAWGSPCQPINSESQFKSQFHVYAETRIRSCHSRIAHINGNSHQGLAQRGMRPVEFYWARTAWVQSKPRNLHPDFDSVACSLVSCHARGQ